MRVRFFPCRSWIPGLLILMAVASFMVILFPLRTSASIDGRASGRPNLLDMPLDHWWDGFEDCGFDDRVCALVAYDGRVAAGGHFRLAGAVEVSRVASWNGEVWSSLGSGTNGDVNALVEYKGELIAGGWFSLAGGEPASNIARWDGSAWKSLASGLNGRVLCLREWDGCLVAGGMFEEAGGAPVGFVASWDGGTWSALGDGLEGPTAALALYNGHLVAAGSAQSGDQYYGYVATWDGTEWEDLGDRFDDKVSTLLEWDDKLVAGGWFAEAGEQVVNHVAAWDGDSWGPLGDGMGSAVWALAEYGGDLTAGGAFEYASGMQVGYISRWEGDSWADLDGGVGWVSGRYGVFTLLPCDGSLYVGGGFPTAGGRPSSGIARWDDKPPDPAIGLFQNPYLTRYVDIYIIAPEPLKEASLRLEVKDDEIPVEPCCSSGRAWVGNYELPSAPGPVTIRAFATDEIGNSGCTEIDLWNGLLASESGGVARSADGRFEVEVYPGDLAGDLHVLVLDRGSPATEALEAGLGAPMGVCMLGRSEGPPAYLVSPSIRLEGVKAEVRFYYDESSPASEALPEQLHIVHDEMGPLHSYIDRGRGTVCAWTDRFGGFRIDLDDHGVSDDVEPGFLFVARCAPNPFGEQTRIRFEISARQRIQVSVYDVRGRRIKEILNSLTYPGITEIGWDGTTETGARAPSGCYLLRFAGARTSKAQKILLLR